MPHFATIARPFQSVNWTVSTSAPLEWAWLAGRLAIAVVIIPFTLAAFGGASGAEGILATAAITIVYSAALALLLKRGRVSLTFWSGFALDNFFVISSWWWTVRSIDPAKADNDLWLAVLPVIILGVARLGTRPGILYLCAWLLVFTWLTVEYQPTGSYGIEQLPTRLLFIVIVGAITIWLVARLNIERRAARRLQMEAEQIAEIGRIIGSSLTPASVFPLFASRVRTLVPYQRIGLVELDSKRQRFWMVSSDGDQLPSLPQGQEFPLPQSGVAMKVMAGRQPQLLDTGECEEFFRGFGPGFRPYAATTKSMIIAPISAGDRVIGILFARSNLPLAFTQSHLRIMVRIADYIGGAMANAQIYRQTIELAEEHETRQKLDSENRDLHRQNHARTMFLSAVSHELRTPLTSIIAFNDMLLKNKSGSFSERDLLHLNVMRRNSQQLYVLVNDLLDLSHIESGRMQMAPEEFPVGEAITDIASSMEPVLKPRRQRLKLERPKGDMAMLTADRQRLAQVVSNLISNASKYSPEGSEIRLTWRTGGGRLEVAVADSGSGIPEKMMPLLFEPFFRVPQHRAEKIPGTGLGLVISKSLVEAHGGEIRLESTEGKGTTASFWIPLDGSGLQRRAPAAEDAA